MRITKKSLVVGTSVIAFVLAGSLLAWACTSLATLEAQPATGQPGDEVKLSGQNFDPEGTKVQIRFDSLDGPVLASGKPEANGDISATVTIPKGTEPGQYVLIAEQQGGGFPVNGMAFGTPARTAFIVPGPAGAAEPAPNTVAQPIPPASIAAEESSTLGWVLLAVLGALALLLFAGGLAAFLATVRRREVATVPWETR